MKIGILGLLNSGKTTIFNALTGLDAEITSYATNKIEPNLGVVDVEDERVKELKKLYKPDKTKFANIEYIDFVGLSGDEKGLPPNLISLAKRTDAIALVIRNFDDEVISETCGKVDPLSDIEKISAEMIISDLLIAEKRLENIQSSKKKGIKEQALILEEKVLHKISETLSEEIPVRDLELSNDEKKAVKGFQFITQKPLMIILNSDENNFGSNQELIKEIEKKNKVIEFAGNFEMELYNLSVEDALEFLEEMNIAESARVRLTKFSYDLLGYISFFTVRNDEVKAWTITKGATAVEAAAKIHSDLARGFIRAECFSYENLICCGSESTLREKGLYQLEGKNFIVKDGDVLNIRFSV